MSKRPAGALAGIAMILLFAVPAAAAQPPGAPHGVFDVPHPTMPFRDFVVSGPDAPSARISATANTQRYPIGDHAGSTIAVGVTAACRATCDAADPQAVAGFIGTLPHGREVSLLTVQLDARWQIGYDCGYGAQACYDTWRNTIIVSGDDDLQPDGATRNFVLAHEYGHHVAAHRPAPPPFAPAIDWGTPRWSSYENVCRGQREGYFFPGNEARLYYLNPGEAFAEAFAYARFPGAGVSWAWTSDLKPNAFALAAIRRDVYRPWSERTFTIRGHLPGARDRGIERIFRTPIDGRASFRLRGRGASRLSVRNGTGPQLHGASDGRPLRLTVCDQGRLRAVVKRLGHRGGSFALTVQRP